VARCDQDRHSSRSKRLQGEVCGFAGDVILFEQVATTGDQVDLGLLRAFDDSLQRVPQILSVLLCPSTVEALAGQGPVEVQVSEMEQAKGH
jgi:hypothetical protein